MKQILAVIDMQNDFISGSLGTKEAQSILESVVKAVEDFNGDIFFTRDTHSENYLSTNEGKHLPVLHCVKGTSGHELAGKLKELSQTHTVIDKSVFGSTELIQRLIESDKSEKIDKITLIGVCTDICVASNALCLKTFLPETEICVISSLCAGTTPENHLHALEVMKLCQVTVL